MSAMVVDSLGRGLFLPFSIVFFLRTTPLSLTAVGLALSAAGVLALPPVATFGWMVDRLGPRTVIVTGNLAQAAGFVGFLWVSNISELIVLSLLVDCGSGMFWTANPALINLAADPGERFRFGRAYLLYPESLGGRPVAPGATLPVIMVPEPRVKALADE
ncbi:MAG: MFS transporter [Candidatus Dormibacteria bacterium]